MVHVTLREIEDAFQKHYRWTKKSVDSASMTEKMVLFYAVECGLKAIFMKKNRLNRTEQLIDENGDFRFKHNINELLKETGFSITIPPTAAKNHKQIAVEELHQAWRYGKSLDITQDEKAVKKLNQALDDIKDKISTGAL